MSVSQIETLIRERDGLAVHLENLKKELRPHRVAILTGATCILAFGTLEALTAEWVRLGKGPMSDPFAWAVILAFVTQLVAAWYPIHAGVRFIFRSIRKMRKR